MSEIGATFDPCDKFPNCIMCAPPREKFDPEQVVSIPRRFKETCIHENTIESKQNVCGISSAIVCNDCGKVV